MAMKRLFHVALWLVALMAAGGGLLLFESDLLWKVQEMNLFLTTPLFFEQQMVVAGGLLVWLGTFLTQFLYYPWLGVLLLCGLWLLLMGLTMRTFRLPREWAVLPLLPVALLLVANVDQGYWVYVLKLRGSFFIPTIGTLAVVALLRGWRALPQRFGLPAIGIALTAAIGYPLLGVYALAAALLMGVWAWRLRKGGERIADSVVAVTAVVAVPLLCYRYVYYQTRLDDIYWAGLPLYSIDKAYPAYYLPYVLLAACYLAFVMVYQRKWLCGGISKGRFVVVSRAVSGSLLVLAIVGVVLSWYKDDNFHRELKMQRCIEQTDWEGVLKVSSRLNGEPTRAIVLMRNLALARLGRQSKEMYGYRNGQKRPNAPFTPHLVQTIGAMLYYQYGLTNYSYRLGMELGVEYGWRACFLKLMARNALMNGEYEVARKYTGQLRHTLFFGDWADEAEALADHPDEVVKGPERNPIAHMMRYASDLTSDDGNVEGFLMKSLANTLHHDPYFQEQALIAALWMKDPTYFWPQFMTYLKLHPNDPVPRYFQEAAFLFAVRDQRKDIDQMPFDPDVRESFGRFMQQSRQYEGEDVEKAQRALAPYFGDTYYYHYFLMRIQM